MNLKSASEWLGTFSDGSEKERIAVRVLLTVSDIRAIQANALRYSAKLCALERLLDDTGTPEDQAYMNGINDCIRAIEEQADKLERPPCSF